jgi:hypothetical protein
MLKILAWGRVPQNVHVARSFAVFKSDGLILKKPKYCIKISFMIHSLNNKHQAVNIVWEITAFIAALNKHAVCVRGGASTVTVSGADIYHCALTLKAQWLL